MRTTHNSIIANRDGAIENHFNLKAARRRLSTPASLQPFPGGQFRGSAQASGLRSRGKLCWRAAAQTMLELRLASCRKAAAAEAWRRV